MKKNNHKFLILTVLFSAAVAIIHLINKFIAATAQLKEMLDLPHNKYFEWRFGKIHYTKKGNGTPVLLIHDILPGASRYEWHLIEHSLAKEHTVYTIDLLGCGSSDKPGITYTNFLYVQLICDFIKEIISEKTDIITSGFTGSFAIMACVNEKELINKIIMINPPKLCFLKQMPSEKHRLLKFFLEIPVFGTLVYHMIVSRESIDNLFIEHFYHNPFHMDQDFADAYYEAAHKGGKYAKCLYASFAARYMNIDITQALEVIDNSIFIIEGASENNAIAITEEYKRVNPSIETVIFPNSKHLPHIEAPKKLFQQLIIYL